MDRENVEDNNRTKRDLKRRDGNDEHHRPSGLMVVSSHNYIIV